MLESRRKLCAVLERRLENEGGKIKRSSQSEVGKHNNAPALLFKAQSRTTAQGVCEYYYTGVYEYYYTGLYEYYYTGLCEYMYYYTGLYEYTYQNTR